MTASATLKQLSSNSVEWLHVNLTGSTGAWFRVDLLSGGTEVARWRGLTTANANPFTFTPAPTAPIGSKLYVTGFFPDGASCSTTLVSS